MVPPVLSKRKKEKKTRAHRRVEYLVVYFHVIPFEEFILERACEPIKTGHPEHKNVHGVRLGRFYSVKHD